VPEGRVFGLLAANAADKTTAIRAAVGLLRGARGEVRVDLAACTCSCLFTAGGALFARAEVR